MARNELTVNRRKILQGLGASTIAGLAGCTGSNESDGSQGNNSNGGSGNSGGTQGNPFASNLASRLSDSSRQFIRNSHMADSWNLSNGSRPVKVMGQSWAVNETTLQSAGENYNLTYEGTTVTLDGAVQRMRTGSNSSFDLVTNSSGTGVEPIIQGGATQTIPRSKVPRWVDENMSDVFTNPMDLFPKLNERERKRLATRHMWADPSTQDTFRHIPFVFNMDSIGYNPDEVDVSSDQAWGALFDTQYKGRVAPSSTAGTLMPEVMMYLRDAKIIDNYDNASPSNPSKAEIDTLVNFLIDQKNKGQFRTTWTTFGESVNLFSSGEAVVADLWEPAVLGVRSNGTPCSYLTMPKQGRQGLKFWIGTFMATKPGASQRSNVDEVAAYANSHLGEWFADAIMKQNGYTAVNYEADYVKEAMGPEFYNWAYNGQKTYQEADDALFLPSEYDWSMEKGEPADGGAFHDRGSVETRIETTGTEQRFPENVEYLQQEWTNWESA